MKSRQPLTREDLTLGLMRDLDGVADKTITGVTAGASLVAVTADRTGLCSNLAGPVPGATFDLPTGPEALIGQSARESARMLLDPAASPLAASLAMAAANALLPPPAEAKETKAQELILRLGRGGRVVVAGHFPFVERMGASFSEFTVLEKNTRPGDKGLDAAPEVLGRADLAALTAQTLVNGDLAWMLSLLRPEALVIMIGPSAPFAPSLFAAGINVIAGCDVADAEPALADIASGAPFRGLRGVSHLTWENK